MFAMSMAELELALAAVRDSDIVHFVGPQSPQVIEAAEEALGVTFPPTYRRFVAELGTGYVGPRKLYGVTAESVHNPDVRGGIWYTLDQRERYGFPEHLVIVGDTGMGEFYVLDTSQPDPLGEFPVVIWFAGGSPEDHQARDTVAPDFGSYLWEIVQQEFGTPY